MEDKGTEQKKKEKTGAERDVETFVMLLLLMASFLIFAMGTMVYTKIKENRRIENLSSVERAEHDRAVQEKRVEEEAKRAAQKAADEAFRIEMETFNKEGVRLERISGSTVDFTITNIGQRTELFFGEDLPIGDRVIAYTESRGQIGTKTHMSRTGSYSFGGRWQHNNRFEYMAKGHGDSLIMYGQDSVKVTIEGARMH